MSYTPHLIKIVIHFYPLAFFRVAIEAGANPRSRWGECTKKKKKFKNSSFNRKTNTDRSIIFMKFKNDKSVDARKNLDVGLTQHIFSGQLGVWLPTGYKNESRKIKSKQNQGRHKGKKKLVNHLGVQSFDSTGQLLWDLRELEFTLGSRQSHGHIGYGMTGICFSPCGLPSPGNWKWFGRVAGLPLVK